MAPEPGLNEAAAPAHAAQDNCIEGPSDVSKSTRTVTGEGSLSVTSIGSPL